MREEFVYNNSQKLFGIYNFGVVHVIFFVCRSLKEQKQLSKPNNMIPLGSSKWEGSVGSRDGSRRKNMSSQI